MARKTKIMPPIHPGETLREDFLQPHSPGRARPGDRRPDQAAPSGLSGFIAAHVPGAQ
jgi:hypothetical protein